MVAGGSQGPLLFGRLFVEKKKKIKEDLTWLNDRGRRKREIIKMRTPGKYLIA